MLNKEILKQIRLIQKEQPGLEYIPDTGFLSGKLKIEEGDEYSVDIELNAFPLRFPKVWETGERIPKTKDRHIYDNTQSCCFTTSAKEQILLKTKIKTLHQFINLIVIPYFQNNSFYELNRKYKYDGYQHGIQGIMQGYCEIMGTNDISITVLALMLRVKDIKYSNYDKCFCGEGNISECHLSNYIQLYMVDKDIIIDDLNKYFEFYKRTIEN